MIKGNRINEEEIREIILSLLFSGSSSLGEDEFLYQIILQLKCDLNEAKRILNKMKILGLEVCKTSLFRDFDLEQFAKLRGYFSDKYSPSLGNNWN